jgi:hypothetical protein
MTKQGELATRIWHYSFMDERVGSLPGPLWPGIIGAVMWHHDRCDETRSQRREKIDSRAGRRSAGSQRQSAVKFGMAASPG